MFIDEWLGVFVITAKIQPCWNVFYTILTRLRVTVVTVTFVLAGTVCFLNTANKVQCFVSTLMELKRQTQLTLLTKLMLQTWLMRQNS